MKLAIKCQWCNKTLDESSTFTFGEEKLVTYKCGHFSFTKRTVFDCMPTSYNAAIGDKSARPYQVIGINEIRKSGLNFILGDQMRLGKTNQSLIALRETPEALPALILVRSANLYQWREEIKTWFSPLPLSVYLIQNSKSWIPPGFDIYLLSMDSLRVGNLAVRLAEMGIKTVIADEVHSFKNADSARSIALVDFIRDNEIQHKIFLSGTVIKNRADEFFVPLNLVAPTKFPSLHEFRRKYLMKDDRGQFSRVAPYALNAFKEAITPFYMRREKEDVYSDTPELNRMFSVISIENDKLKALYNAELDKIEEKLGSGATSYTAMSENLMTMRRIAGAAKVDFVADYVDLELETSEKSKIAIGLHHHVVRDLLIAKLGRFRTLQLSGEDSPIEKFKVQKDFEKPEHRVAVLSMMAAGVGMDFHYCNNVIVMERQWSSADEEQFEYRFYNPDKSIKTSGTDIEYIVVKGTIDGFFYDMVEEKRKIFGETLGTNWSITSDASSFKELMERTVSSRLK